MEDDLYLSRYWHLPFSTRFIGLFALSMMPLAITLAIGETIAPNEGILNGACVYFFVASLTLTVLTSLLSGKVLPVFSVFFIDLVVSIVTVVTLQLTYTSASSTGVLLGACLLMYLLRIRFLYRPKTLTVTEFFQGQFKTDSVLLIAVGCAYTLTSLYHQHLIVVELQIAEVVIFCLLLWTVVLRQLEKVEHGLHVKPTSYVLGWIYTNLFVSLVSFSAVPGMREIGVVRHKYAAPPPLEIQIKREQQQESILKRLHVDLHAFLNSNTTYVLSVVIFAVIILALGMTLLIVFRKRISDVPEEHALGSLAVTERRRIDTAQSKPMLKTNRPLRLLVQAYLHGLEKKGAYPETWRTVRGIEHLHRDQRIESIIDEYEQERYKPADD